MKTAPATATLNVDIQITVIQPGGNQMTTTLTVDLLLRNLPPEVRLGHRLPGLVNNRLSVAALVDAGCKVFFHCTGCKVTFNGAIILQGWRVEGPQEQTLEGEDSGQWVNNQLQGGHSAAGITNT